jgi:TPP-dependent pyruvate/acetoin dehydrogenase alpha subunit
VTRAKDGGGPTFIEAQVYRFRAHGGAGDDSKTGYRAEAERDAWAPYDPITMLGQFLKTSGVFDDRQLTEMEAKIAAEIADAFDFALNSPNPVEADLYKFVYA